MNPLDIILSDYGRASVEAAPVSRMMAEFAAGYRPGVDINLGVGYVNEATIPRRRIEEALHDVLGRPEQYPRPLNYGDPAGSANLIAALRRFLAGHRIGGLTDTILQNRSILIGASGATSLLEGIARVLPAGIVLCADPMYYIYSHLLERCGFEVVAVPEDDQGLSAAGLQETLERLGPRRGAIRFFYVVTVNNPTGTILANARRRELVAIAERLSRDLGRAVPLIFDAAYENLIHDPRAERPQSALTYDPGSLVYEIATLSKIIAPALRIGYLIGPDGDFLRALTQHVSDVGFSAPLITQEIAARLLEQDGTSQLDLVNRGYRIKALQTQQWIDEQLGIHLAERRGGRAGFYFYLTFREIVTETGSPFFRYLMRTTGDPAVDGPADRRHPRVLYLPGQFCVHRRGQLAEAGRRQMRLSYGFEEPDRIGAAIKILAEAARFASTR